MDDHNLASNSKTAAQKYLPPQDLEAERSLLASILVDSFAVNKIVDIGLTPDDFYREAHGKVFASILSLVAKSEPLDMITLSAHLRSTHSFDEVGGTQFITGLFNEGYSSAHVGQYAKIVKEMAVLRRIISASNKIIESAYSGIENMEDFLDDVESQIFEVTNAKMRPSVVGIREVLLENMARIKELSEKEATVTGLATGFTDFDNMTSGLQGGQLVVIAARPAMGKTSLALNMAQNMAISSKSTVVIFSLEMGKEELVFRFLTGLAKVDASSLKVGKLSDRAWKSLHQASNVLSQTNIMIDDTAALSVMEMRSKCRRVQAEKGINLVIVDYLQLMRGSSKGSRGGQDNREREISEISRGLKSLAKELRVPVIALSQLNRGVEARSDKRPMLSDLRESGAIEQDADIVAFVYRDEVYNKNSEDKGKAEFIIAKHRSGSVGTIRLNWNAEFTAFSNEDEGMVGLPISRYNQSMDSEALGADPHLNEDLSLKGIVPPLHKKGNFDLPNF